MIVSRLIENAERLAEHIEAACDIAERVERGHSSGFDMPTLVAHLHVLRDDLPDLAARVAALQQERDEAEKALREIDGDLPAIVASSGANGVRETVRLLQSAYTLLTEYGFGWDDITEAAALSSVPGQPAAEETAK